MPTAVHSPPTHAPPSHSAPTHASTTHAPETHGGPTHEPPTHEPPTHAPQAHEPQGYGPLGVDPGAEGAGGEGVVLSRRVPQAHLAPELRRHGQARATAGPEGPLPDAAEARAALSRYQASRQAARAVVDDGAATPGGRADEVGPEGPPSAGGWS